MSRVRNTFWKKTIDKLVQSENIPVVFKQYINFGVTGGETGYGFRDEAGVIQFKNSGGSWVNLGSGGGGGGSGITRSVASVSTPTTAAAAADTDYVYLVTNTTITLPTAVANTNHYTIKCVSGTCVVAGHASETIDGTATITFNAQSSVDLISDGTNFNVI